MHMHLYGVLFAAGHPAKGPVSIYPGIMNIIIKILICSVFIDKEDTMVL